MDSEKTPKAQITRQRILDAALPLFLERGFEKVTMRAIASKAELSLGAAYYYFRTKEHIVHEFYSQTLEKHFQATRQILDRSDDFRWRLQRVLELQIEVARPFHLVSRALFRIAADPTNSLSPFSHESQPIREASIGLFGKALAGSNQKIPKPLAAHLPTLLWLFDLAVILFWIFDRSPEQKRTFRFIAKSTGLAVQLLNVARLPLFGKVWEPVFSLLGEFSIFKTSQGQVNGQS